MLEINDVFTIKISMTTENLIMVRKKSEKVGNRVIKAKPRDLTKNKEKIGVEGVKQERRNVLPEV